MLMKVTIFKKDGLKAINEFTIKDTDQKDKVQIEPGVYQFITINGLKVLTSLDFVAVEIREEDKK